MKKILLLAVVGFGVWNYYSNNVNSAPTNTIRWSDVAEVPKKAPIYKSQSNFSCDGRQHCSQMRSRAEAEFFTRNCPNTKMDGDRDGIPCENDSRF